MIQILEMVVAPGEFLSFSAIHLHLDERIYLNPTKYVHRKIIIFFLLRHFISYQIVDGTLADSPEERTKRSSTHSLDGA